MWMCITCLTHLGFKKNTQYFWSFIFLFLGAQMEVDYTEKLNFSDDEENHSAKDKGDNW